MVFCALIRRNQAARWQSLVFSDLKGLVGALRAGNGEPPPRAKATALFPNTDAYQAHHFGPGTRSNAASTADPRPRTRASSGVLRNSTDPSDVSAYSRTSAGGNAASNFWKSETSSGCSSGVRGSGGRLRQNSIAGLWSSGSVNSTAPLERAPQLGHRLRIVEVMQDPQAAHEVERAIGRIHRPGILR